MTPKPDDLLPCPFPPQVDGKVTSTSERQDDLSIYSELRVSGFTREELVQSLVNKRNVLIDSGKMSGSTWREHYASLVEALINMGAVRVKP